VVGYAGVNSDFAPVDGEVPSGDVPGGGTCADVEFGMVDVGFVAASGRTAIRSSPFFVGNTNRLSDFEDLSPTESPAANCGVVGGCNSVIEGVLVAGSPCAARESPVEMLVSR